MQLIWQNEIIIYKEQKIVDYYWQSVILINKRIGY